MQGKLVLGMSHDLRTPSAGLMAYLEDSKKAAKEVRLLRNINKAFDRVLRSEICQEQMFEYFFVNSTPYRTGTCRRCMCAFGDYLSELCALLEYEGFQSKYRSVGVETDICMYKYSFIGQIMNNIISNIRKIWKT